MSQSRITIIRQVFDSRLSTLDHLLTCGEQHAEADALLQNRIAPDMHPLGTQIAFTCNQPRNFAQWCADEAVENLDPEVRSLAQVRAHIASTSKLLAEISIADSKLDEIKRVALGGTLSVTLDGHSYVNDFLMPNFYFHMVTAYDILRMAGVQIGKRDFMLHLAPFVEEHT